jgi:DNA-binding PadR family transcriptional regulator
MFRREELRLIVLKLIADEPRHGYDLIREIETMTKGAYAPSPGVVYPLLTLLDEMELTAEQVSEGAKKRYAITEAGRRELAENAELVEALMAQLREMGAERSRGEGTPIRRAMQNLRVALQHRVQRGEMTEDTLHDIAALIDEVAQRIERLR